MAELRGGGAVVAAGEVQGTHEWLVQSSALCTAGLRLIEHLGFTKVGSVSRPTGSLIRELRMIATYWTSVLISARAVPATRLAAVMLEAEQKETSFLLVTLMHCLVATRTSTAK